MDNEMTIINLSSITLTEDQEKVLRRGLSFAPTTCMDHFEWIKDVNLFCRKLLLYKFFSKNRGSSDENAELLQLNTQEQLHLQELESLLDDQGIIQTEEKDILSHLKPQSTFCPPWQICPPVEVFLKMVTEDFKKISTKMDDANLTRSESVAIKELKEMRDIVIKPSDKGGNIVIWPESPGFAYYMAGSQLYTTLIASPFGYFHKDSWLSWSALLHTLLEPFKKD
ncbi:uncharacterized protein LOC142488017 [Ascaphus truei]|uniref:uncharacterized protein LOC142488017 n=1 Tax=Ascaphus truei TaxID=8439 RepID=UPI003F59E618